MKLTLTRDWFVRRVALEGNLDIAAGLPTRHSALDQQGPVAPAPEEAHLPATQESPEPGEARRRHAG